MQAKLVQRRNNYQIGTFITQLYLASSAITPCYYKPISTAVFPQGRTATDTELTFTASVVICQFFTILRYTRLDAVSLNTDRQHSLIVATADRKIAVLFPS
mgnify:CR=1 FL=1